MTREGVLLSTYLVIVNGTGVPFGHVADLERPAARGEDVMRPPSSLDVRW